MFLAGARWVWPISLALVTRQLLAQGEREVAVQMQHVDFHVDSSIVLRVDYLRGALEPTSEHSPYFDDKGSFSLAIDSARIRITPAGLSDLLNHYTFAYPGSPLRRLTITIERGQLKQKGTLRGVSFTMLGELTLTPSGELRLHPHSIKAEGIGVGGLMKFLGLHLDKLVKVRNGRGVRIEKNDFFLSPPELLPPPSVKGRVGAIEVNDSEIVQVFQPPPGNEVRSLTLPEPKAKNYMYYRGNVLRFGKLTMHDTDLLILDAVPEDPFDFFLDEYKAQLVAGYSRTRADQGLTVVMQDHSKSPPLPAKSRPKASRRSRSTRWARGPACRTIHLPPEHHDHSQSTGAPFNAAESSPVHLLHLWHDSPTNRKGVTAVVPDDQDCMLAQPVWRRIDACPNPTQPIRF